MRSVPREHGVQVGRAVAVAVAVTLAAALVRSAALASTTPAPGASTAVAGDILVPGTVMRSPDGRFTLSQQNDGNLVLRAPEGARPVAVRRLVRAVRGLSEIKRLAETIDTRWPEIDAFLQLAVTNARTEGSNRTIKQIKRVACGMPNRANYERRILAYANAKSAA